MEKVPMTLRGEQMLRTELERLLKLRPQISEAIAEARELGDLKKMLNIMPLEKSRVFVKRKSVTLNISYLLRK